MVNTEHTEGQPLSPTEKKFLHAFTSTIDEIVNKQTARSQEQKTLNGKGSLEESLKNESFYLDLPISQELKNALDRNTLTEPLAEELLRVLANQENTDKWSLGEVLVLIDEIAGEIENVVIDEKNMYKNFTYPPTVLFLETMRRAIRRLKQLIEDKPFRDAEKIYAKYQLRKVMKYVVETTYEQIEQYPQNSEMYENAESSLDNAIENIPADLKVQRWEVNLIAGNITDFLYTNMPINEQKIETVIDEIVLNETLDMISQLGHSDNNDAMTI